MYRIVNRKFAPNTPPPDFYYGESPRLEFAFPSDSPHVAGDLYALALDDDLCFAYRPELGLDDISNQLFAFSDKPILSPESGSVSFNLDCYTTKFRERIGCRQKINVWLQLLRLRNGKIDYLLVDRARASGVVYSPLDSATPAGRGVMSVWLNGSQLPNVEGRVDIDLTHSDISDWEKATEKFTPTEVDGKTIVRDPVTQAVSVGEIGQDKVTGLKQSLEAQDKAIRGLGDANTALNRKVDENKTQTDLALNDKANKTDIHEVPTVVSAFQNDSGYQTSSQVGELIKDKANRGDVPSKVSQLENDSSYQTASDVSKAVTDATKPLATKQELTQGLERKANTEDIPEVPTVVSAFQNDAKYQTESEVSQSVTQGTENLIGKTLEVRTLSGANVTVRPSTCSEWNAPTGECTLNVEGWSPTGEQWSTLYVTPSVGTNITGGTNLTLKGSFEPGKRNYCQLKGFKGQVRLYVLEVED